MVLYINTKDKNNITVAIKKDNKLIVELSDCNEYGSQVLLSLVEEVLEKANLRFEDLEAIEVEVGPGSYTGLKVGVSVANALGFSLGIPVNGKRLETELVYA